MIYYRYYYGRERKQNMQPRANALQAVQSATPSAFLIAYKTMGNAEPLTAGPNMQDVVSRRTKYKIRTLTVVVSTRTFKNRMFDSNTAGSVRSWKLEVVGEGFVQTTGRPSIDTAMPVSSAAQKILPQPYIILAPGEHTVF